LNEEAGEQKSRRSSNVAGDTSGRGKSPLGGNLTAASHQLRAPLVAMQTVLKVLLSDALDNPEKRRELVLQAYNRCEDMLRLVNDLLEIGRTEDDDAQTSSEPCDPAAVLDKSLERMRPLAEAGSVALHPVVETIPETCADPDSLEHIFTNLVENAIKYTPDGGTVDVSLSEDDGKLVFSVKDTGIGIDEEDRENIFRQFWRADNARRMKKQGTGLGLPIVKGLVEKMGGELDISGRREGGTEAVVTLPIKEKA